MNETLHMIKCAFTGHWNGGDWIINSRFERWFYRLKAALCVLLNREYDHRKAGELWNWFYDGQFLPVVSVHGGVQPGTVHGPTVYWAEELAVGRGVFRNWVYVVNSVSSD